VLLWQSGPRYPGHVSNFSTRFGKNINQATSERIMIISRGHRCKFFSWVELLRSQGGQVGYKQDFYHDGPAWV